MTFPTTPVTYRICGINIEIDSDNDTMRDDAAAEITRCLRAIISKIEAGQLPEYGESATIFDACGNRIGAWGLIQAWE